MVDRVFNSRDSSVNASKFNISKPLNFTTSKDTCKVNPTYLSHFKTIYHSTIEEAIVGLEIILFLIFGKFNMEFKT